MQVQRLFLFLMLYVCILAKVNNVIDSECKASLKVVQDTKKTNQTWGKHILEPTINLLYIYIYMN